MCGSKTSRYQETGPSQDVTATKRHRVLGTVRATHIHCRHVREVSTYSFYLRDRPRELDSNAARCAG